MQKEIIWKSGYKRTNVPRVYSSKPRGNLRFIVFDVLVRNESRKRTERKKETVERTRKTTWRSGHEGMPTIFRARSYEKLTIRNLLTRNGSTFLATITFFHRNQLIPLLHFRARYLTYLYFTFCFLKLYLAFFNKIIINW